MLLMGQDLKLKVILKIEPAPQVLRSQVLVLFGGMDNQGEFCLNYTLLFLRIYIVYENIEPQIMLECEGEIRSNSCSIFNNTKN